MGPRPGMSGTGTVDWFDEARGLGAVRSDDGALLPFHCTAITDGSRAVAVGRPVRFRVAAGHLGRWEAAQVTPL
jgi:cold shock CspA family protein